MTFRERGLIEGYSKNMGYIRRPFREKGGKKPTVHAQMRIQERQLALWSRDL